LYKWVEAGGRLYLSGDLCYDENRRRLRAERLEKLCGVLTTPGEGLLEGEVPAGATVTSADADTRLVDGAYLRRLGSGAVWFEPEPPEMLPNYSPDGLRGQYRRFADWAGVGRLTVAPNAPGVHVFRLGAGGREAYVVFNRANMQPVRFGLGGAIEAVVGAQRPGAVVLTGNGIVAAEADGLVRIKGAAVCDANAHYFLLSLDGRKVSKSRCLLAVLLQPGRLRVWSDTRWVSPVAELGDLVQEQWVPLERSACRSPEGLSAQVGEEGVGDLLLLSEKGELEHWRARAENLVLRPQRLPW